MGHPHPHHTNWVPPKEDGLEEGDGRQADRVRSGPVAQG